MTGRDSAAFDLDRDSANRYVNSIRPALRRGPAGTERSAVLAGLFCSAIWPSPIGSPSLAGVDQGEVRWSSTPTGPGLKVKYGLRIGAMAEAGGSVGRQARTGPRSGGRVRARTRRKN